jgi:hypothetical protein
MQRIFAERMLSPVYDLVDASSHEWRGLIQDFISDVESHYRFVTPLGLYLRGECPVLLCSSICHAE